MLLGVVAVCGDFVSVSVVYVGHGHGHRRSRLQPRMGGECVCVMVTEYGGEGVYIGLVRGRSVV